MSTYLVAFIVAEFIGVSNNVSKTKVCVLLKISVLCYKYYVNILHYGIFFSQNVVQVSVYAVPDKKDQVQYALDTACKLLEFYNTFFEYDYPLSKLGETPFLKETLKQGLLDFQDSWTYTLMLLFK